MACSTCNKSKCGCKDTALTSIPQYQCPPDLDCPVPSPCDEYYDSRCVLYNGAEITDLNIQDGASLQSIIQRLVLAVTGNISCVTGACQATFNLFPASITATTITMSWEPSATATDYQLEYKTVPAVSWNIFPIQTTTTGVISGLTAGTEYLVRVNSLCGGPNCYSVTLKITTSAT